MNPPPARSRPHSTAAGLYLFCPFCGTSLALRQCGGRQQPHCLDCGFLQYRNPIVGVAIIVEEADLLDCLGETALRPGLHDPTWRPEPETRRILLARRANSFRGRWCLPCGFVEYDEELREAAVREAREETGLEVEAGAVFAAHSNFHLPDAQTVGIWFRAKVRGGRLRPGDDVDALGLFDPAAVPVDLAFPTDARVLADLAALFSGSRARGEPS